MTHAFETCPRPSFFTARRTTFLGAHALALLCAGCFTPSEGIGDTDGTESGSGTGDDGPAGPAPDDDGATASMTTSAATSGPTSATGDGDDSTGDGVADATDDAMDDTTGASMDDTTGDDDSGGSDSSAGSDSSGEPADTTPPEIVSISPDVGASGIAADVLIAITFSEPMDTVATEAAFSSADLGGVAMTWNAGDTVLTIDPDADLEYAAGSDPAAVVANEYALSVGVGATDLAGNALAMAFQSSFFTLREISATLANDAALTGAVAGDGTLNTGAGGAAVAGDHADNLQRKGFFSFALGDLPPGIVSVEQATLSASQWLTLGTPFSAPPAGLGSLGIDHVEFDALDIVAFTTNPLDDLGVFSSSPVDGLRAVDVTANVDDDVDSGRSHSQYRLEFPTATNNNAVTDRTRFHTPVIDLVYLVE